MQLKVSTHSHPKVAGGAGIHAVLERIVSTHSHPKVAGPFVQRYRRLAWFQHTATRRWLEAGQRALLPMWRFNTQPPEGGWACRWL